MAAPRVFISSTFYDLKQVRNNIGDFIKGLGYEPVMHERSGVAYTHITSLEIDCYHELASCDIVVCIIGNHFGSKSSENDLSITMNEIQTAIKNKKKVYIFIASDVYTENRTYMLNKEFGTFKSAYTDDIKIHEFIAELNNSVKNHVIEPFDTTDQIIDTLRSQFAGLLQNLLQREASLTDATTAYDLQQSADQMKAIISDFKEQKNEFFKKFDASIFTSNYTIKKIKQLLGLEKASIFAKDVTALDEIMLLVGFRTDSGDEIDDYRTYIRSTFTCTQSLILKDTLFDESGNLKDIRSKQVLDTSIIWKEEQRNEDDLPF